MTEESAPRKKRRRSSLAPSRNKLELTPAIGKDLYKSVDNTLSAEERIEELCKLCVQCAVDHVSYDCDTEEKKMYLDDVSKVLLECLDKPEMKESRSAMCTVRNLLPNPENLEMDAMIQEYETRINRLKKEEEDWNKLFQDLEEKSAQAQRLNDSRTLAESELTEEQRKLSQDYLPQLLDLNNVSSELCCCIAKLKLLVREHEKKVCCGWKLQQQVSEILDNKTAELRNKTFGNLESPRNLIGHQYPTPPSTPTAGTRP